jgi:hypothetical protein
MTTDRLPRTRHRLARLTAGITLVAATTATTLLGATTPAYAAQSTPSAAVTFGLLGVTGSTVADVITATGSNGTISLSNSLGSITAGTGCVQLGATVRCTGVKLIEFQDSGGEFGGGGDDTFRNNTSTRSNLFGGFGNDKLTGGSGKDRIAGGPGTDAANGGLGVDSCTAETESNCEQ